MVKLYCDRCRKEIQTRYHTINFYGHDVHPRYDCVTAVDACVSYVREDALAALNAQKMYCTECKAEIECFCAMAPDNRMKA